MPDALNRASPRRSRSHEYTQCVSKEPRNLLEALGEPQPEPLQPVDFVLP